MRRLALATTILSGILTATLHIGAAQAQSTRTWVSGVGDDANPCSRTAPCKTFAGAIAKTAAGGEINCTDAGGFGNLTITKSITIDCRNTEASVLSAGTDSIIVNAGVSDVVVLRGLDLIGTVAAPALNGINFLAGGSLHVEQCTIREYLAAAPNGNGILFQPSGASKLFVSDTTLTNNGTAGASAAITVQPTAAGSARANISGVRAQGNNNGIAVNGTLTNGQIVVYVNSTIAAGSAATGVSVVGPLSGGGPIAVMLDRSSIVNNGTGIVAQEPQSAIFLSNTTVFGNITGGGLVSTGGAISSYQNNTINGGNSPTDGAPNVSNALN